MTDRLNGVFVVFETDTRVDDAEATIAAIKMLRGVLDVRPNVSDPSTATAELRVRNELGRKLLDIIYPPSKP